VRRARDQASAVDRRTWLAACLGTAIAAARTDAQARTFKIGILAGSTPTSPESRHIWQAFYEELRARGYVEGQNLVVEGRYYGDNLGKLQGFATELVRLQVDVIVAAAPPAPETARSATSTIPIVIANHSDPVGSGLAASLAKPGGNVTGLSLASVEMRVKQVELLKETVPGLTRVAFLRNPGIPFAVKELDQAVRTMNLRPQFVDATGPNEFAAAFAAATRERAGAVVVLAGTMFFAHRTLVAELAAKHRLPTVYMFREHAEAGGLMTYGVDLRDNFRRAAGFVDKILKGARPGDLPIERPTKFALVINLKAAKALGLAIPPSVLARADQIIE
jgi:putative ABC transport system substrate-binding protein